MRNIKTGLDARCPGACDSVKRLSGRLLVSLSSRTPRSPQGEGRSGIQRVLENTFGIANFSFAREVGQDVEEIKKGCEELLGSGEDPSTPLHSAQDDICSFRISTQRSEKSFPMNSQVMNEMVGQHIVDTLGMKVNLDNPDIACFIEIVDKRAFIYTEKIPGPGGLPLGISGKVICLLSGGIDSPVAAYYAMKRGDEVIFVHFHSIPYTSPFSIDKVKRLAGVLKKYQPKIKLYTVEFAPIQKQIMIAAPEKFRILLYRRFMMRIAEAIAKKENAKALITGEALGQVASQTLENMAATEDGVSMLVLRPLIGFDKKEIIKKAEQIGTFEISKQPHDDCCTLFMPKHPVTKARLDEIRATEMKLNINQLVKNALDDITIEQLSN